MPFIPGTLVNPAQQQEVGRSHRGARPLPLVQGVPSVNPHRDPDNKTPRAPKIRRKKEKEESGDNMTGHTDICYRHL